MMPGVDLIRALMLWVASMTGYPLAPLPPMFHQYISHPDWAAYTSAAGINLGLAWQPDAYGYCILAHELTHWLQYRANLDISSPLQAEPPAYHISALCFQAYNLPTASRWATQKSILCSRKSC